MYGAMYNGIKDVTLEEFDKPTPGPNDVVVEVKRAGICGTDLHAYLIEGESVGILPGNQFGHEMVGEIHAVGENITEMEPGMRVFVDPNKRKPLGQGLTATQIADMAGAFSEYVLAEEATFDNSIIPLPAGLSYDKAVLTEPFSVAMHGVNICDPKPGQKAVIYGAGIIGLCAIAVLKSKGINDIIINDIVPNRLKVAEELGAIPFNSTNGNYPDFIKEQWGTATDSMGNETINADIVLDIAGYEGVLTEFLENAKSNSALSVVALGGAPEAVVPYVLVAKDIRLLGSRGYTAADVQESLTVLNDEKTYVDPLFTNEFPLSKIVEAFEVASDKDNELKVVINYEK